MAVRHIRYHASSVPVLEGAGVRLRRAFGHQQTPMFDPFLMLDDFGSDNPADYEAGFPWHPHRGIETITYVLEGRVEHRDSLGNAGVIGPGDVQWMTAGSGIIHQEMPEGNAEGRLRGLQLWSNLPAAQKMMPPRYRGIAADDIPVASLPEGVCARVICGETGGVRGPVQDVVADPTVLDIAIPECTSFRFEAAADHTMLAYVLEGEAIFEPGDAASRFSMGTVVLYEASDAPAVITAAGGDARVLLAAGKPLGEPIAWRGPIVMCNEADLAEAFEEYRNGTFVKSQ